MKFRTKTNIHFAIWSRQAGSLQPGVDTQDSFFQLRWKCQVRYHGCNEDLGGDAGIDSRERGALMVTRLDPRGRWLSRERGGQDFLAKTALNPHKQITGPYRSLQGLTIIFKAHHIFNSSASLPHQHLDSASSTHTSDEPLRPQVPRAWPPRPLTCKDSQPLKVLCWVPSDLTIYVAAADKTPAISHRGSRGRYLVLSCTLATADPGSRLIALHSHPYASQASLPTADRDVDQCEDGHLPQHPRIEPASGQVEPRECPAEWG
ncbi:hypothetical protein CF327_g5381 [Tilletia walkeri]|nr:hypothetical protein CF327_g5381 [Tilletia walkeri]